MIIIVFFLATFTAVFFQKTWYSFKKRKSRDINYLTLLRKNEEDRDRVIRRELNSSISKKTYQRGYLVLESNRKEENFPSYKTDENKISENNLFSMFD